MNKFNRNLRDLIEKIRQRREADQKDDLSLINGADTYLGHISEDLYSAEFHFILELIQNAVDNSRRNLDGYDDRVRVQFHLKREPKLLFVANNGKPFSEEDIKRLCGVTKSRKGIKKIGYKGIGFKSVARISHNPQIYSPGCRFEFNKSYYPDYENIWLVIPHWIDKSSSKFIVSDWVNFILPLREDLTSDDISRLSNELDSLSPELLLFLNNLERLEIQNDNSQKSIRVRKRISATGLVVVEQTAVDEEDNGKALGQWIVTSHSPQKPIPEDGLKDYVKRRGLDTRQQGIDETEIADTQIVLAFRVDDSGCFIQENGPLFAFFPIDRPVSGLRFSVQADFLTTAGRETLAPSSAWNNWLLSNLPDAIEASIKEIKQRSDGYSVIYESLPLRTEGTDFFNPLVIELLSQLDKSQIVITDLPGKDKWVLSSEAVWLSPSLHPLLDNTDLHQFFPDKRAFVSFNIRSERAEKFLTSSAGLKVDKIGKVELLKFLEETEWLESKPISWFVALFRYLADANLDTRQQNKLRRLSLVPTSEGLVQANDDNIFIPADASAIYVTGTRFIHPALVEDAKVVSFLTNSLEIQKATHEKLIKKVILPTLLKGTALSKAVLVEYVIFVRTYYENTSPDVRSKLQSELRNCFLLEAENGSWRPASELCLRHKERKQFTLADYLLKGASLELFVRSPQNIEKSPLEDFYEWLGVHTEPPVKILSNALKNPDWFARKSPAWFQTLYAYLGDKLDEGEYDTLRELPIIPVKVDSRVQICPFSSRIFFQIDLDLSQLKNIVSTDKIALVDPNILSTATKSPFFEADGLKKARRFLEDLGIRELRGLEFVEEFIIKEFEECAKTGQYYPDLLNYTRFAFETFERYTNEDVWQKFEAVVRLKTSDGSWQRPSSVYLTKKYNAHDFETLLGGFQDVYFLSSDYLKLFPDESDRQFLIDLGVLDRLEVTLIEEEKSVSELVSQYNCPTLYLEHITEEKWWWMDKDRRWIRNHATMNWLEEIIETKDENRLEILLRLLADFWQGEDSYSEYKVVRCRKDYSSEEKQSYIAWLLQSNDLLPTNDGLSNGLEYYVYRDAKEIRELVGDNAVYLCFKPTSKQRAFLEGFMGVIWEAEDVSPEEVKENLRQLKKTDSATPERCAKIYEFLAEKDEFTLLEEEALLFLPTNTGHWWKISELFWHDYKRFFGYLRGYVSTETTYQKLYPIFEKIGLNMGEPQPENWADFLCDISTLDDPPKSVIWQAYEKLEICLREESEEPEWWEDFVNRVEFLTENGSYQSPKAGLYIPDHPLRYELFKDVLPFIWLQDSAGLVGTLLQKLELRSISAPRWIEETVYPGELIQDDEKINKIRKEIIENRRFIRSILIHKYPQREVEFRPLLALLKETTDFKICLVNRLKVHLRAINHPGLSRQLEEQLQAHYSPHDKTLYIIPSEEDDAAEIIGLGVTSIFRGFEDSIRSDLMLLFSRRSHTDKVKLLKNVLHIPLHEEQLLPQDQDINQESGVQPETKGLLSDEVKETESLVPETSNHPQQQEANESQGFQSSSTKEIEKSEPLPPKPDREVEALLPEEIGTAQPSEATETQQTYRPILPSERDIEQTQPQTQNDAKRTLLPESTEIVGTKPESDTNPFESSYDISRPTSSEKTDWQPEYQPDEVEIRSKKFQPSNQPLKKQSDESSTEKEMTQNTPPRLFDDDRDEMDSETLSQKAKRDIGVWGEKYALEYLKKKFLGNYPQGKVKETDYGFIIESRGQVAVEIYWLNKHGDKGIGYDIKIKVISDARETFWEVKSTKTESKQSVEVSGRQWILAREKGDHFHILRVYNAGTKQARLDDIPNPFKLWQEGRLNVLSIRIRI